MLGTVASVKLKTQLKLKGVVVYDEYLRQQRELPLPGGGNEIKLPL